MRGLNWDSSLVAALAAVLAIGCSSGSPPTSTTLADGSAGAGVADSTDGAVAGLPGACTSTDPCHAAEIVDGQCQVTRLPPATFCGPGPTVCSYYQCGTGDACELAFRDNTFKCATECGSGRCDGIGECRQKSPPAGSSCSPATKGPCIQPLGTCGVYGECIAESVPAGTACAPGPAGTSQCLVSATCNNQSGCDAVYLPQGATCTWYSTCDGAKAQVGYCDAQHACKPPPNQPPVTCQLSYFTEDGVVGIAASTWGKQWFNTELNPCFAAFTCDLQAAKCKPAVNLGAACTPAVADPCVPAATCDAKGFCSGPPVAGLPCPLPAAGPCTTGVCTADGKCTSVVTVGAACSTGDPCRPNGSCGADATCTAPIAVGATCTTNDTCMPLGSCNAAGKCQGGPIEVGKVCGGPVGLCSQLRCQADGSCAAQAQVGKPCQHNVNPCKTGTCDAKGVCVDAPVPGASCKTLRQPCGKGVCDALGVCVESIAVGAPCYFAGVSGVCTAAGACISPSAKPGDPCVSPSCSGDPADQPLADAAGQCKSPGAKGKPCAVAGTVGLNCAQSCTCNAEGGYDYVAKPDGAACAGGCAQKSVCVGGACAKDPADDAGCQAKGSECVTGWCCSSWDNYSPNWCSPAMYGSCLYAPGWAGTCQTPDGAGYCQTTVPEKSPTDPNLATCWVKTSSVQKCQSSCQQACYNAAKSGPCIGITSANCETQCTCGSYVRKDGQECGKGLQCKAGQCVLP